VIPGGLGSSVSRPHYNRGVVVTPGAISRTPLGTVAASGGVTTMTIAGITVPYQSALIIGLTHNNLSTESIVITVGGLAVPFSALGTTFTLDNIVYTFWCDAVNAPYNGNLVIDFTGGADQPTVAAAYATAVANLQPMTAADQQASAAGPAATTQDSGLTPNTTKANEYVSGTIGTSGSLNADADGAWQTLAAGQSIGTAAAGCKIKEGWFIAAGITTFRSEVLGATSRRWASNCVTFKGAA
jgi:hypothetical protein